MSKAKDKALIAEVSKDPRRIDDIVYAASYWYDTMYGNLLDEKGFERTDFINECVADWIGDSNVMYKMAKGEKLSPVNFVRWKACDLIGRRGKTTRVDPLDTIEDLPAQETDDHAKEEALQYLHAAFNDLSKADALCAQVARRKMAGETLVAIAASTGFSERAIRYRWSVARRYLSIWLHGKINLN